MFHRRVRVYVSGPYTSDPEANVETAIYWANELWKWGYTPVVPHLCHFWDAQHPGPYEQWMDYSFELVYGCDIVFRFTGDSPGAERELQFAREHKIPIYHDFNELIERRHELKSQPPVGCSPRCPQRVPESRQLHSGGM